MHQWGLCVMVPKFQWKPSWLATQWDPQNDWTGWQIVLTTTYWHRSHPQIVILSKEQYSTGGAEFIHQFRSYASQRQKINPGCWRGAAHAWDSHVIQPVLWSVHRSAGGTLPAALTYCNTCGEMGYTYAERGTTPTLQVSRGDIWLKICETSI